MTNNPMKDALSTAKEIHRNVDSGEEGISTVILLLGAELIAAINRLDDCLVAILNEIIRGRND